MVLKERYLHYNRPGVLASDAALHSNMLAKGQGSSLRINRRHRSGASTTKPMLQHRLVTEIEKLGAQGIFVQTDVSSESQIAAVIQQTLEHFGGLDILVNNAGIHIPGGVQELSIADWDKVVGVNLRGIFVATKLAIPYLKQSKFGRIIQIASVHAYGGGAGPCVCTRQSGCRQHGSRYRIRNRFIQYNRQRHLPGIY